MIGLVGKPAHQFELCECSKVNFAICDANTRVDMNDLRHNDLRILDSTWSLSRFLQSVERTGYTELTLDDTFHFNHGTL